MKKNDNLKERIWESVEANILTDGFYKEVNREVLQHALENLPLIQPEREIWPAIEKNIKNTDQSKIKFTLVWQSVAAIFIILLVSAIVFMKNQAKLDQIADKEENNKSVETFLDQICSAYPGKCQSPDFLELQSEILKLQTEKTEIQNQIFFNSDDQQLNKICTKIDDQIILLKRQIEFYVTL